LQIAAIFLFFKFNRRSLESKGSKIGAKFEGFQRIFRSRIFSKTRLRITRIGSRSALHIWNEWIFQWNNVETRILADISRIWQSYTPNVRSVFEAENLTVCYCFRQFFVELYWVFTLGLLEDVCISTVYIIFLLEIFWKKTIFNIIHILYI